MSRNVQNQKSYKLKKNKYMYVYIFAQKLCNVVVEADFLFYKKYIHLQIYI